MNKKNNNKVLWGINNGYIEVQKSTSKNNGWGVYYKIYLNVDNNGNLCIKTNPYKNIIQGILNTNASLELNDILNKNGVFSNAKPTSLIKHLINIATNPNDIILDFFAGSGTTAH